MEAIKLIKIGAHKSWEALLEKHKEYVEEIYAEDVGKEDLINSRILFAIHLKKFGTNPQIDLLVEKIAGQYEKNPDLFRNSVGAIFISSEEEEYTKQTASILEYKMVHGQYARFAIDGLRQLHHAERRQVRGLPLHVEQRDPGLPEIRDQPDQRHLRCVAP